jgi:hypothetical protein
VDDVARGRRLVLSALGVVAAGGLAGGVALFGCLTTDTTPVGFSAPRAPERSSAKDGSAPSPVPADFRTRLARVSDRILSRGHANGFDAIVWANEPARSGSNEDGGFADRSMFVEEALDRSPDAGSTGLLVMDKRAGDWHFGIVNPDGEVAEEPVATTPCTACHREAPRDFVFLTTPPASQSSNAATTAPTTATAPSNVASPAATYDARSAGSAAPPSSR